MLVDAILRRTQLPLEAPGIASFPVEAEDHGGALQPAGVRVQLEAARKAFQEDCVPGQGVLASFPEPRQGVGGYLHEPVIDDGRHMNGTSSQIRMMVSSSILVIMKQTKGEIAHQAVVDESHGPEEPVADQVVRPEEVGDGDDYAAESEPKRPWRG